MMNEWTPSERVASALRRRGMSLRRLVQAVNDRRWILEGDHVSRDDLVNFIDNDLPALAEGGSVEFSRDTASMETVRDLAGALRVEAEWILYGVGEPPAVERRVDPLLLTMIDGIEDKYQGIIEADQRVELATVALKFIKANGDVDMHGGEADAIANRFVRPYFNSRSS